MIIAWHAPLFIALYTCCLQENEIRACTRRYNRPLFMLIASFVTAVSVRTSPAKRARALFDEERAYIEIMHSLWAVCAG